jgi:hypothetical protein
MNWFVWNQPDIIYQKKRELLAEEEIWGMGTGRCQKSRNWEMAGSAAEVWDGVTGPSKSYWTGRLMVDSTTATEFMKPLSGKNESDPFN